MFLLRIDTDEDKQQQGEAPQRGAAVADERQRDADDRNESDGHADVDDEVEEQHRCHPIAIHAHKGALVPLGQHDDAEDERKEKRENHRTADA